MREHHALGLAGGAAGVDEGEQVVGLHGGFQGFQGRGITFFTNFQQLAEVARTLNFIEGEDVFGRNIEALGGFFHLVEQLLVGHEHGPHAGISEDILVVLNGDTRVHRHADGADLRYAEIS